MRRACVAGPPRLSFICLLNKLGHGKRARAVDADEQVKLAFNSLHLGDVDVKEADKVALELRSLRLAVYGDPGVVIVTEAFDSRVLDGAGSSARPGHSSKGSPLYQRIG